LERGGWLEVGRDCWVRKAEEDESAWETVRPVRLVACLASVVVLILSGCVVSPIGHPDAIHFNFNQYGVCPADARKCDWSKEGGTSILLLSGLDWKPMGDEKDALHLWWFGEGPLRLVIEDFRLQGFRDGIFADCTACIITLRNGSIVSDLANVDTRTESWLGPAGTAGLQLDASGATVIVENVTIAGFTACVDVRADMVSTWTSLELHDCGAGMTIMGGSAGRVSLRNVAIAARDTAIFVGGADLQIDGSWLRGGKVGLGLPLSGQGEVGNTTFLAQTEDAVFVEGDASIAILGCKFADLHGNALQVSRSFGHGNATIHDSTFSNVTGFAVLSDAAVEAQNNYWGSPLGPSVGPRVPALGTGYRVSPGVSFAPWKTSP
jgi:hypothetical protein